MLPLETLRELVKLAGLRKILDRRSFDQLKNHVRDGNFLSSDDREALDLVWELREHRVFSDDEYDEQIDAQVLRIVGGSAPAISPKHPACLPQEKASDGLLRTQSAYDNDLDEHEQAPGGTPERGRQATEKPGLENLLSYLTTGVSWKGRNIVTTTWGCVSPYYSYNK